MPDQSRVACDGRSPDRIGMNNGCFALAVDAGLFGSTIFQQLRTLVHWESLQRLPNASPIISSVAVKTAKPQKCPRSRRSDSHLRVTDIPGLGVSLASST